MVGFGAKKKAPAKRRESLEMDRNLSCEELDSDDLGGELNLSDREDGADERVFRKQFKSQKRAVTKTAANVYR